MLRRRCIHRDMADVNVFTAKKLNDMASSLGELAKACADDVKRGEGLTRDDGLAALQAAASLVCGDCDKCNIYADNQKEDSYYLYYLIRSFEQKGILEFEDMPRFFLETCRKKEDYLGQLNRSLGRATMNLAWKNRFLESRDAMVVQFREMAVILEEFSHQMEQAVDITSLKEGGMKRLFSRHHMAIENLLVLEYENHQREAFLTVKTTNGRCVTSKEAAQLVGQAMGTGDWIPARDSKSIITRQRATVRFLEEGAYQMFHGVARAAKGGEGVSGDNYTVARTIPGRVLMSLSDGMGTGEAAEEESRQVVELTQQLLETGFSPRAALKLVNTVLLLAGMEQHPATLDLCCVDLHTGVLEAMKLGAAATFVLGENGVELLEAGDLPIGALSPIEPVLLSRKLWDEDRVIMVSDGVLDPLPGEEKELVLKEYIEGMAVRSPQDMAERILGFARSYSQVPRDDMTVLAAGIWKRK